MCLSTAVVLLLVLIEPLWSTWYQSTKLYVFVCDRSGAEWNGIWWDSTSSANQKWYGWLWKPDGKPRAGYPNHTTTSSCSTPAGKTLEQAHTPTYVSWSQHMQLILTKPNLAFRLFLKTQNANWQHKFGRMLMTFACLLGGSPMHTPHPACGPLCGNEWIDDMLDIYPLPCIVDSLSFFPLS